MKGIKSFSEIGNAVKNNTDNKFNNQAENRNRCSNES